MADWTKFNAFVEGLAEKKFNLGSDTLKIALTNTAPTAATDDTLSDITQIAATGGYAAATVTVTGSSQTGGTYTLTHSAVTFSASGADFAPFRYAVLYDDTATNDELIAYYDYGVAYTLPDGQSFVFNAGTIMSLA
jgi:hypothetical protein